MVDGPNSDSLTTVLSVGLILLCAGAYSLHRGGKWKGKSHNKISTYNLQPCRKWFSDSGKVGNHSGNDGSTSFSHATLIFCDLNLEWEYSYFSHVASLQR